MKNRSVSFLANKYLKARAKGPVGRSHYLTLAGIALGVMALLAVSSVMNGFQDEMRGRLIGSLSEMRVSPDKKTEFIDPVPTQNRLRELGFQSAPVIRLELMLKRGTIVVPSLAFGIDPHQHQDVSNLMKAARGLSGAAVQGVVSGVVDSLGIADGGIVLGAALAYQLGVQPGDRLQVLSPLFNQPTAFGLIPKLKTLKVLGIVSSGMPEYDQSYSYIPLATAAWFKGSSEIDYLELKTPDRERVKQYSRMLSNDLKGFRVEDWSSFDPSLFTAMRFEKFLMFVIMLFMYIIASFNLTGNMLKTVSIKKRELGLLKAIGLKETDLSQLFLQQALILASIGILGGLAIAALILWLQQTYGIIKLPLSEFETMVLPVKMQVQDVVLVIIMSYGFTLLSTLIPLSRLKQINSVDLIRQSV